jgi:hypothetical protein
MRAIKIKGMPNAKAISRDMPHVIAARMTKMPEIIGFFVLLISDFNLSSLSGT